MNEFLSDTFNFVLLRRFALVSVGVILMLGGPASSGHAADGSQTVLEQWDPAAVSAGDWAAKANEAAEPYVIGHMTCTGRQRAWELADKGITVGLRWHKCSNRSLLAADLHDIRRRGGADARSLGNVLGNNHDVAIQQGDVLGRIWIEGDYRISVLAACALRARQACLTLTDRLVRDLSAKLPGEAGEIQSDRQQLALAWLSAIPLTWGAAIGIAMGLRRLARRRLRTLNDHPRWTNVGGAAARHRRKMRLRRAGVFLLLPFAGQLLLVAASQLFDEFDASSLASLLIGGVCLGGPGLLLLSLSRDPGAMDQLSIGRELRQPRRRRWATSLLMVCAAMVLAGLMLTGLTYGGIRTLPLPPDLEALAQMTFLALFGVAWGLNRLVRHRIRHEVWASIANRAAPPILLLRGMDNAHPKLRAAPIYDRGPLGWAGRLLVPQRRQCLENVLAAFLARHARVISLQPFQANNHPIGPQTYRLPDNDWQAGIRYAIEQSYAVVLLTTARDSRADGLHVAREAVRLAADKPLLLVLPTATAGDVLRHWAAWIARLGPIAPVAQLHPMMVAEGTHVLAHLPGQGWFAWGADIRDEWTYAESVHDALARITAIRGASVAAGQTVTTSEPAGSQPVTAPVASQLVIAAPGDMRVAHAVADGLATMGVAAQAAGIADDLPDDLTTAVVVLSDAATADDHWRQTVSSLEGKRCRLIPVVQATVDAAEVPEPLRTLNWVRWDQDNRARAHAELFAAVNSEPSRYRVHRDLMSRARTWVDNNRSHNLLIGDLRDAEQAHSHLARSRNDPLARPNALLHDFVTASLSRAQQRAQRQRLWLVTGAVVGALSVSAVAALVAGIKVSSANNRLVSLAAVVPMLSNDRPDWAGLLAGALVVQGNPYQAEIGRRTLRVMLNRRWGAFLGAGHDSLLNDMAAVRDGHDVLVADEAGSLSLWERDQARLVWRKAISRNRLEHMAVTGSGDLIAVAAGRSLHLIRPQPWKHQRVELPSAVAKLALSQDGTHLAAATTDHRIEVLRTADAAVMEHRGPYHAVAQLLSSSVRGDEIKALVRLSADELAVIDPVSGRTESKVSTTAGDGGWAALSPQGAIATASDDGELLYGSPGSPLRRSGQRLGLPLSDGAFLPSGLLVVAGRAYGVQLIDPVNGILLERMQVEHFGVDRIRISPDGRHLMTTNGFGMYLWDTAGMAAVPNGSGIRDAGTTTAATTGGLSISSPTGGQISITRSGEPLLHEIVTTGDVTAVTLSGDGRSALVGSSHGEVVQIDVAYETVVRRWKAPEGGRITTVGWAGAPGRLLVGTARGTWWTPEACDGCGADGPLLDALRSRIRGCYRAGNLDGINATARARLGVRVCAPSPAAQEG